MSGMSIDNYQTGVITCVFYFNNNTAAVADENLYICNFLCILKTANL